MAGKGGGEQMKGEAARAVRVRKTQCHSFAYFEVFSFLKQAFEVHYKPLSHSFKVLHHRS